MKIILAALCVGFFTWIAPAHADSLPPGVTVERNIAYGPDKAQRFDVYLPAHATRAPILFMVHGGGWRVGDKGMGRVVDNKVARWLPKGIIFVTVNYRMDDAVTPLMEAEDVAAALVKVQALAPSWGGDAGNVILMGHSAGGHLVTLLNMAPEIAAAKGAMPWRGTVSLDSGVMNVPATMQARHLRLYDEAFGKDPARWEEASPYHRVRGPTQPLLGICRQRSPDACPQNRELAAKANQLGGQMDVMPMKMSHGEINSELGLPGALTERVEAFMRKLGWQV